MAQRRFPVLVATDGSPAARAAVEAAIAFPWPRGSTGHGVVARHTPVLTDATPAVWEALLEVGRAEAHRAEQRLRRRWPDADVAGHRRAARPGNPRAGPEAPRAGDRPRLPGPGRRRAPAPRKREPDRRAAGALRRAGRARLGAGSAPFPDRRRRLAPRARCRGVRRRSHAAPRRPGAPPQRRRVRPAALDRAHARSRARDGGRARRRASSGSSVAAARRQLDAAQARLARAGWRVRIEVRTGRPLEELARRRDGRRRARRRRARRRRGRAARPRQRRRGRREPRAGPRPRRSLTSEAAARPSRCPADRQPAQLRGTIPALSGRVVRARTARNSRPGTALPAPPGPRATVRASRLLSPFVDRGGPRRRTATAPSRWRRASSDGPRGAGTPIDPRRPSWTRLGRGPQDSGSLAAPSRPSRVDAGRALLTLAVARARPHGPADRRRRPRAPPAAETKRPRRRRAPTPAACRSAPASTGRRPTSSAASSRRPRTSSSSPTASSPSSSSTTPAP